MQDGLTINISTEQVFPLTAQVLPTMSSLFCFLFQKTLPYPPQAMPLGMTGGTE